MSAAKEGIGDKTERGNIGVDRPVSHQSDETAIHGGIFFVRGLELNFTIQPQRVAAFGQEQAAIVGVDGDVPGLRPGLTPIEHGVDRRARCGRHGQRRTDRGVLVGRHFQIGG